MNCSLYVINDRVTQRFGEVFEADNDATVRRSFTNAFKHQFKSGIPVQDLCIICIAKCDKSGSVPVVTPVPVPYTVLRGDEIQYDENVTQSAAAYPDHCNSEDV